MRYRLNDVPDDKLLVDLKDLVASHHRQTAHVLAHIAEVDTRRLYLKHACSSMFAYCCQRLGMSEDEAYKRIRVARMARRFPEIFEMVAQGELHLSGIARLAAHLKDDNHGILLKDAKGQTTRKIEAMLAARFPSPDIAASMRKLPAPKPSEPADPQPLLSMTIEKQQEAPLSSLSAAVVASEVTGKPSVPIPGADVRHKADAATAEHTQTIEEPFHESRHQGGSQGNRDRVTPIAAERFKVQFTASRPLRDKIRLAQDLLRHQVPAGDLAAVCERAFDVLLAELTKRKYARLDKRAPKRRPASNERRSRHIPHVIKRDVWTRDGGQCTFVDADGNRCRETGALEFHPIDPCQKGGAHTVDNVALVCRPHNRHYAERDYGKAVIERHISKRRASLP